MNKFNNLKWLLSGCSLAVILSACGQRGPLYLPNNNQPPPAIKTQKQVQPVSPSPKLAQDPAPAHPKFNDGNV